MKLSIALPFLLTTLPLLAQIPAAPQAAAVTSVPRLVRINSSFHPMIGLARSGAESATLAIYADETGGTALWQETQNVVVDSEGRYSLLLGSTRNEGLPVELFTSGESRWLGVLFHRAGEVEQPRVLMATVPYALKAIDADTLGGQPASAYLLAPSATVAGSPSAAANTAPGTDSSKPSKLTPKVASGTANSIAKFVNTTDLGNSVMVESNGRIGIGTSAPAAALEVATTGGGAQFTNTQGGSFAFNTFSSPGNASYLYDFGNQFASSGRYIQSSFLVDAGNILSLSAASNVRFYTNGNSERMRIDSSGNIGIGTASPAARLDVSGDINLSGNLNLSSNLNLSGNVLKGGTLFLHNLGTDSTAVGLGALTSNTASGNTAVGRQALAGNTSGNDNAALGSGALFSNLNGSYNVAAGSQALNSNSAGSDNVAIGRRALLNSTGSGLTAVGFEALRSNTTGTGNVAIGESALAANVAGNSNTAVGDSALQALAYPGGASNTANTAVGYKALYLCIFCDNSTALGAQALYTNVGGANTAVGARALYKSTGTGNTALGEDAGGGLTSGNSNVMIASFGTPGDDATIRIGDIQTQTFIAGISGVNVGQSSAVFINSNGQLGTVQSSRRYKEDIADMGLASANLSHLRPVTFRYKKPLEDGSKPLEYGLIAEEVAEVYPDLVVRNKDGQIETVQYQKLTPMLLNELQKGQQHAQQQDDALRLLNEKNRSLEARLAALEALLLEKTNATGTR